MGKRKLEANHRRRGPGRGTACAERQTQAKLREQASAGDLTPSQTSVLMHLDREGPTTVTALARTEGVRSQSMGATVAVLEAPGWSADRLIRRTGGKRSCL